MPTASPKIPLPVVVANPTATFDCIFGRGCEGICCQNGRPSLSTEEQAVIQAVLPRVLPLLRPEARRLIETEGFVSRRQKVGQPMVRVVGGWCVFFHHGCTLHQLGAADGDALQYKPTQCALFPLEKGEDGRWFIRQWGYENEQWDLFCLNPKQTRRLAVESLGPELALAAQLDAATPSAQPPQADPPPHAKPKPRRQQSQPNTVSPLDRHRGKRLK
jgi:hypothetical protein